MTATIAGISGSLRKGSYNSMLLAAAARAVPPDVVFDILSIRDVPLYDADVEAQSGTPESVRVLKDRVAAADGLLIATPEYNNSIPGVAKNAIDWMSRPAADIPRVFGGLAVALMGATTTRGATSLSQAAWLPVLRTLGTRPWFGGRLEIARAADVFDADGLRDDDIRARLERFVRGFAEFVSSSPRAPR